MISYEQFLGRHPHLVFLIMPTKPGMRSLLILSRMNYLHACPVTRNVKKFLRNFLERIHQKNIADQLTGVVMMNSIQRAKWGLGV